MTEHAENADVIVVGAGPGGSATAAHLANLGLDVVLLEKQAFPRDKICGDGLTPRAVKELINLGVDTTGWARNKGLRILAGGRTFTLDWPQTDAYPPYGLVRARATLDQSLAQHALRQGATLLEHHNVTEAIRDERTGRIQGVVAKVMAENGRATGERRQFRAPVVVAADGNSSRLSLAMDRPKRDDRPMGVAVRGYYANETRAQDDYMESWLELWVPEDPDADPTDPAAKKILLPGYGWLFGTGEGTVNVGLGIINTSKAFGQVNYQDLMRRWVAAMPAGYGLHAEQLEGEIRGAALPMAFNRQPLYADGLLLVGDAGGMINPFNGEGIDYALESGRIAAHTIAHAVRRDAAGRERVLRSYETQLKDDLGGYFQLGAQFAKLIGHPEIMKYAVRYGLPRTAAMKVLLKMMSNLAQPKGGHWDDRLIMALTRIAPDA